MAQIDWSAAMETFTIRDLRERTGELVRGAEAGKLSLVTKHGLGVFVAMPFDEELLRSGVRVALAVKLFDEETISLGKAAKLAGVSLNEFINHLGALKIPLARYDSGELAKEVAAFA
jgi:prevent-host-death family protein